MGFMQIDFSRSFCGHILHSNRKMAGTTVNKIEISAVCGWNSALNAPLARELTQTICIFPVHVESPTTVSSTLPKQFVPG